MLEEVTPGWGTNRWHTFPWREGREDFLAEENVQSEQWRNEKDVVKMRSMSSSKKGNGEWVYTSKVATQFTESAGLRWPLALTLNWASGGPVMMTILSLTSGPSAGAICSSQGKRKC
jgi:hypothetical protein